jgi:Helix-turn-helix domain
VTLTRPTNEVRLLLKPDEAASALAISPRTLHELTSRGELVPIRLQGRDKARALRYAVADLIAWIERQKLAREGEQGPEKEFLGESESDQV